MKLKITFSLLCAMLAGITTYAQFFDSVPYRGAFGIHGQTKAIASGFKGYDPDPSNTDADWTAGWANFAPNAVAYPGDPGYSHSNSQFFTAGTAAEKVTISADIASDMHLTSDKWYEISGLIHVLNGATLTIDAGTCIRGSLTNLGGLIISQGGKIMAIADKNHPVVMTSQKPQGSRVRGDWAGLLILGLSSCNDVGGARRFEALPADPLALYGGGAHPNEADNSGSIRYMRVEFAGYNYLPDQEINGVTFGAVGSGSHFDYMQSSFANDDGFEWFGGTCNHKYLISYAETDDEFDMDEGFHGNLQYLLGLRSAGAVETSPAGASNGLEHDNNTNLGTSSAVNPNIIAPTPTTAPTISNMTLVGPEHPGAFKSSLSTLWQQRAGEQMRLRTNDATGVFNSIAWGYPTTINLPNVANLAPAVQTRAADDELSLRNTTLISGGAPDVRFNSSNFPTGTGVWATGATVWTSLTQMRDWVINGPAVSVYGYTGATHNDTTQLSVSTNDITHPDYSGTSNGALSQLDYTVCDFTLTGTSSVYWGASNFQHPRVSISAQPTIAASPTILPSFSQFLGTPSAAKLVIVKSNALSGGVLITAPAGFEVSSNGTSGWSGSFTKGTTPADTTIYVRLNKTSAGTASGYLVLTSTKGTPEFNPLNISVSGTCIAPATPYINVSVAALTFSAPSVMSFNVSGKNLTADVTITASANFQVSNNATTGFASTLTLTQTAGNLTNTPVFVKYSSTGAANTGNVAVSTTGSDVFNVALMGNSAPTINVLPGLVQAAGASQIQYPAINTLLGTPSVSYPLIITASMLTDSLKIGLIQSNSTALSNFELSMDSAFTAPKSSLAIMPVAGIVNTTVYVRYNASSATTNAGFVTVTSAGAPLTFQTGSPVITGPASQIVSLTGRASTVSTKNVTLYAASSQLKYTSVLGIATAPQVIWVSGQNLGNDSIVVTAPANWEVSASASGPYTSVVYFPNTAGSVANTQVFVRYNPSVPFALNQNVLVTASSVTPTPNTNTNTNVFLLVFGVATPTVTTDITSLPTFYTTVGKPSVAYAVMAGGFNLTNNVVVTSSNGFEVSSDNINFSTSASVTQTAGNATALPVYVRYNSNTAGAISGSYVNVGTFGGSSIPVLVSAVAVLPALPVLTVSTASLDKFITYTSGPTAAQSFVVNGLNLVDSLDLTVGSDFELSNDSVNYKKTWKVGADANGKIDNLKLFCRFNRTTAGNAKDTIFISTTGALTQKIAVEGDSHVGIVELNNISAYTMYPNPAQLELNIEFVLEKAANVKVQIVDVSGRLVKEMSDEKFNSGTNLLHMNLEGINNGFYFVSLESLNGTKTSRLVISK